MPIQLISIPTPGSGGNSAPPLIPINPGGQTGGSAGAPPLIPINPATPPAPIPPGMTEARVVTIINNYLASGQLSGLVLPGPDGKLWELTIKNEKGTPKWEWINQGESTEENE